MSLHQHVSRHTWDLGIFNFTTCCQFAFESNCPNLYSHQQSGRVAVVSYPCQNLAFREINSLSMQRVWNRISLWFNLHSLITNGNKNFYIKAFVFFFYLNCFFVVLAHFFPIWLLFLLYFSLFCRRFVFF